MYDVIIIGKGPAGISASLYTKRGNLKTLVIGNNIGALEKAEKIENFYGQDKPVTGVELAEKGIQQAINLGVEIKEEEVTGIVYGDNSSFKIVTDKNEYDTKAIVIATGTNRKRPNINGIEEFEGKGVSYCAICDAFFYRQKTVAVLGTGAYAISEVEELARIAEKVTILTNGRAEVLSRAENVDCNTSEIAGLFGNDKLEKIQFKDNSEIQVNGIFIAEGTASSVDFAKKIGAKTENDKIIVNDKMETSIKGVFAAGDCTGGIYQVAKATHEGMLAGLEVIKFLKN